jgi:hypothetical protein
MLGVSSLSWTAIEGRAWTVALAGGTAEPLAEVTRY